MKFEEWLAVLGFFAVMAVVVFALLPHNLWQVRSWGAGRAGAVDQANAVRQPSPASLWPGVPSALDWQVVGQPMGGVVSEQISPVAVVRALPPEAARRPRTIQAKPGLMPFEQAARVRFNGSIQQISELQQRDGQIHVWLNDPQGREQHLSVAPSWFLQYMGCILRHDAAISGVGFQFDRTAVGASIYVKKLVIGKKVCHLRNDEGFALWSNQLR